MVSPYFNNYNNKSEQGLVADLIDEAININGFLAHYIPNENEESRDLLFSDDPLKKFEHAYAVTAYLSNSRDPGMSNDFFSKFGLEIRNNVKIQISRREFFKCVPDIYHNRPLEGDLIYIPWLSGTGELYEVKFVNDSLDLFTLGRQMSYAFELELELFKYSHDEITTGINEIDIVNENSAYSIEYQLSTGTGEYEHKEIVYQGTDLSNANCFGTVQEWNSTNNIIRLSNISGEFTNNIVIIGSTSNAQYIISSYDAIDEPQIENAYDNKVIDNESISVIDTSEANPFGSL